MAAIKTPIEDEALIGALRIAWFDQLGGYPKNASIAVLCSQIALETGGGKSCVCYNLGNWKRPAPGPGEKFCCFSTFEYVNGERVELHPPDIGTRFAAFDSLADGVDEYLRGMWQHWVKAWPAVVAGDPTAFAQGLYDQGYYTAPVDQYAAGVLRWFRHYLGLLGPDAPDTPLDGNESPSGLLPKLPGDDEL